MLEHAQGFAQRRAADVELGRDLLLQEPRPGGIATGVDLLSQVLLDVVDEPGSVLEGETPRRHAAIIPAASWMQDSRYSAPMPGYVIANVKHIHDPERFAEYPRRRRRRSRPTADASSCAAGRSSRSSVGPPIGKVVVIEFPSFDAARLVPQRRVPAADGDPPIGRRRGHAAGRRLRRIAPDGGLNGGDVTNAPGGRGLRGPPLSQRREIDWFAGTVARDLSTTSTEVGFL